MNDPRVAQTTGGLADTYLGGIDMAERTCSIDGCGGEVIARGWCRRHYSRWHRHGDPLYESGSEHGSLEERFWRKVDRRGPHRCWGWTGTRLPFGYGAVRGPGRESPMLRASRVSWEIHKGVIPEGMQVLHHCDNPPCCNPAHLFLGTNDDNSADKVEKGRHLRGEQFAQAKLNDDAVREIRKRYARGGVSQAALGREYGVSDEIVRKVVLREDWAHVL